jgi:hypothetical protein
LYRLTNATEQESEAKAPDHQHGERAERGIKPFAAWPVGCAGGDSVQWDFQSARGPCDASEDERRRRVLQLRILYQDGSIELLDEISKPRRIAARDENEECAGFREAGR